MEREHYERTRPVGSAPPFPDVDDDETEFT
jgi:hypothetical protein